jgi:hypothetical protein
MLQASSLSSSYSLTEQGRAVALKFAKEDRSQKAQRLAAALRKAEAKVNS